MQEQNIKSLGGEVLMFFNKTFNVMLGLTPFNETTCINISTIWKYRQTHI